MLRGVPEQTKPSSALGITLIVTTLLGWSSVPLFLKHFSHLIDPWTSNGWRYGFSALLWAPVIVMGVAKNDLPAGLWRAAMIPAALNSIGQICFTYAHYKIDPGLLTFGLRLQLVFVAAGAYLLFAAERRVIRHPAYLIGASIVLMGTLGTVLLGNPAVRGALAGLVKGGSAADADALLGVVLAIASGLFFAAYALSVRHAMQGVKSIVAFAAISQYTALGMILLMFAFGDAGGGTAMDLPAKQFGLLLLSALIGIALGHVFYYASIARLGVAVSSGVVQLQPIFVTAASWALFNERMTLVQIICGAAALAGAGIMLTTQHRLSKQDRAARELEEAEAEQA